MRHESVPSGLAPAERSVNPTEEKIAKEIRELKEREEELVRLREENTNNTNEKQDDDTEDNDDIPEKTDVINTDNIQVKPIIQNNNR